MLTLIVEREILVSMKWVKVVVAASANPSFFLKNNNNT